MKSLIRRLTLTTSFVAVAAICFAQSSNTVVAKFVNPPTAGSQFSVALVNTGPASTVSGFAFKIQYDPAQVAIVGTLNNTEQPAARMQYAMGPETQTGSATLPAERIISGSTAKDLVNAGNLVEIKFEKKPGYTAPLKLGIVDRATEPIVDGLSDGDLKNIPHTFDVSAVNQ